MFLLASALYYSLPVQSQTISFLLITSGCLRSSDAGRQANGQRALKDLYGCQERLIINACALDTDGKMTSYNSGRTVPAPTALSIYFFFLVSILSGSNSQQKQILPFQLFVKRV